MGKDFTELDLSSPDLPGDGGKLAGFLLLYLVILGFYHFKLAREGRESIPKDKSAARKSARKKARKNYWDTVSALDLRYGSHVGFISRSTLGAFRVLVVIYCTCFWLLYFKDQVCCDEFILFEAWNFALYSLYFLIGSVISVRPVSSGRTLRVWEHAFVALCETILPTTMFLFIIYWRFHAHGQDMMFPSKERWVNNLFTSMNLGLLLVEISLNRIVLRSRRWMWFSYLSIAYLIYVICIEKIKGNNYRIYKSVGFLTLSVHELPTIVQLLMLQLGCHYIGCIFITLKQRFWTLPLTHPVQGAIVPGAESALPSADVDVISSATNADSLDPGSFANIASPLLHHVSNVQ